MRNKIEYMLSRFFHGVLKSQSEHDSSLGVIYGLHPISELREAKLSSVDFKIYFSTFLVIVSRENILISLKKIFREIGEVFLMRLFINCVFQLASLFWFLVFSPVHVVFRILSSWKIPKKPSGIIHVSIFRLFLSILPYKLIRQENFF